jgi:hypothetical protein
MHKMWWVLALGASIAACKEDAAGDVPGDDAGGAVAASDAGDAGTVAAADASGATSDARAADAAEDGAVTPRDAGAGSDAERPRDAAQDASDAAPSSDASASADAGSAGGGCAGKAYKLCEDFESAGSGALPSGWSAVSGWGAGGTAVADDEHHSGAKSLKSSPGPNGQPRAGRSLSALGATADKHWGRIFYKVKTPATLPPAAEPVNYGVIHNTLVGLKGSTESRVVDTVINGEGKHQFLYNLPDDSCCTGSDYLYTSYDGKWHCAEWYVDAATQQFKFFYDGSEVKIGFSYGAGSTKAHIGQYTQVIVGWINYQTPKQPYYQAWFDDLAIDDARIGCE